jgi:cytidylate kinase
MRSPAHPSSNPNATVVAIDGPSGAGKSTVARALARELGFAHLDTGAMFRAVTWFLLERGVDVADAAGVERALDDLDLELDAVGAVHVGGRPLTTELRTARVDAAVSAVSALPIVRDRLRYLQREFAARGPLVCEGRDMGTVVFPDAAFKFYLDASVEERARRRRNDFEAAGRSVDLAVVRDGIAARDAKDSGRSVAPLISAQDAVRVDTTGLTIDAVVGQLARAVRSSAAVEGSS